MRISDWSSDVCSSDLYVAITRARRKLAISRAAQRFNKDTLPSVFLCDLEMIERPNYPTDIDLGDFGAERSEEHTSELQSLMRISYAVLCLKKKNNNH